MLNIGPNAPIKLLKLPSFLPMSENFTFLASSNAFHLCFTTLRNNSEVPSAMSKEAWNISLVVSYTGGSNSFGP